MTLRSAVFVAVCAVAFATPASAQAPDLSAEARSAQAEGPRVAFANGRVSIAATNASLGEILREWARAGGSRFVNVEKLPAVERVTIRIENETELRALEILLRPLAGYAVTAKTRGAPGTSSIGSVLLMTALSRPMVYGPASGPAPFPNPDSPRQAFGAQPPPDEDGPVRRETPPPPPQQTAGLPAGQSSPLQGTQTQTVPGLGVVTSSQPGAVIPNQNPNPNTARPGGRPGITPTQPRPGGGGG